MAGVCKRKDNLTGGWSERKGAIKDHSGAEGRLSPGDSLVDWAWAPARGSLGSHWPQGLRPLGLREGQRSPWGCSWQGRSPHSERGACAKWRRATWLLAPEGEDVRVSTSEPRAPFTLNQVFSPWLAAGLGSSTPWHTGSFPQGGFLAVTDKAVGCPARRSPSSAVAVGLTGRTSSPLEAGRRERGR